MALFDRDPARKQNKGLHMCPQCDSDYVQPICWEQTGDSPNTWRIWLRCPDCEWRDDAVYDEREIDEYDEWLDNRTKELQGILSDLEQTNMSDTVSSFVTALETDLICADDFRPHRS